MRKPPIRTPSDDAQIDRFTEGLCAARKLRRKQDSEWPASSRSRTAAAWKLNRWGGGFFVLGVSQDPTWTSSQFLPFDENTILVAGGGGATNVDPVEATRIADKVHSTY